MTKLTADHICGKSIELEYKINEWDNRTLMCVEVGISGENIFTNKLIFSAEGIKLQIKG